MPNLSFKGASNFTIAGGNFNEIGGNMLTCNISHFPVQQQFDQLPLSRRADTVSVLPAQPHRTKEGRLDRSKPRRAITCLDTLPKSNFVDPVSSSTRSRFTHPSAAGGGGSLNEPGDQTVSEPIPPCAEGYQYTAMSPQASQQCNNVTPSAPLDNALNMRNFSPETQPQASEGVTVSPPVGLPEKPPSRIQQRTFALPDQMTCQSHASHPQAVPGALSVESSQYTQSPSPITQSPPSMPHQPTDHLPHATAAAMQTSGEGPGAPFPLPQQRDTQRPEPAAFLPTGQPQDSLHWTPTSISRWSQSIQPENRSGVEIPPILAPQLQSHGDCIMSGYPSFHPHPAAMPALGCPQLNYSYSAPWGPLTFQQPYQNHVSHDPYGYVHVHPCVPHSWA
ncbi:hypothetical protein P691DRAFT_807757 [Macrolepiota fuliginosa MF-IS2]|uniref:Uncharacterized protein n=1 Tax=Macrolepiota fuliginosa MF-IS2 TaxID=1400762 RepID=A0A9P5X467_9AGAR|nr:hypothetical protein P691DRAFT_807757 [Macrolepiota fuliginosa MF-IS2]